MDRLSDRGSIPLRSIPVKPWKSLISGAFCYLAERKNAVLNRFKPVQSGKIGVKIGVKIEAEIISRMARSRPVYHCHGYLVRKIDGRIIDAVIE